MKISFCFEAIEFQRHFFRRPSKVRKLVRTNQFQVESTKIGTVRKFVTLQYNIADQEGHAHFHYYSMMAPEIPWKPLMACHPALAQTDWLGSNYRQSFLTIIRAKDARLIGNLLWFFFFFVRFETMARGQSIGVLWQKYPAGSVQECPHPVPGKAP